MLKLNKKDFENLCENEEELKAEIIRIIKGEGYVIAETEEEIRNFFKELNYGNNNEISEFTEQNFSVTQKEPQKTKDNSIFLETFMVKIKSHYVDAGSEDYIYTVEVSIK